MAQVGKKIGPTILIVVVLLLCLNSAAFIVDETKQAILVQLGRPVSGLLGPGLHFKIPFIQEAIQFERRTLDYDAAPAEILTADKKNLVVDNYGKWQIEDPLLFYQRVRDVNGALARLQDIIYAELRVELGRHLMADIIAKLRPEIMESVRKRADDQARSYGINIVDVRIKRADLPKENERAVFERMRTERDRQAKKYRSEGREASLKIKAAADRERTILLAEAYRNSQELRGQGDAEATKIYAEAYSRDPEFFSFMRTLDAYLKSFDQSTTILLSSEDEFLNYFKDSGALITPPSLPPAKAETSAPGTAEKQ